MHTKQQFTTIVLDLLGSRTGFDFDSAMLRWWQDNRDHSGMRLTDSGHEQFRAAGLESWHYALESFVPAPSALLTFNQWLTMPYHLHLGRKNPRITFYGSREAAMFALYGDVTRFVQALKNLS